MSSGVGSKNAELEGIDVVATPQVALTFDGIPTQSLRCHLLAKDVPTWLHFPYIEKGYRLGGDYGSCLWSLFTLHNECLNAWTMLLCGLLSTASLIFIFSSYPVRGADISGFVLFWSSLALHLPFSVCYHLFMPISMAVCNFWRRLDISFVLMMSVQLTYAMSYFVYPQLWQTLLATGIVGLISAKGIHTMYASIQGGVPLDRSNVTRWIGLSATGYYAPILYQTVLDGRAGIHSVPLVATFVVPLGLVGGALVYEIHFPEKFVPGRLDLVGNSHLWMHLGVILAHLMGFCFVLHSYLQKSRQL